MPQRSSSSAAKPEPPSTRAASTRSSSSSPGSAARRKQRLSRPTPARSRQPEREAAMSWADWDPAPLVLGAGALAAWRFTHGFLRLRRRGRVDLAGWDRAVLFAAGLALALLPLASPLDGEADRRLSAHMLQHVLVGD